MNITSKKTTENKIHNSTHSGKSTVVLSVHYVAFKKKKLFIYSRVREHGLVGGAEGENLQN